MYGKDLGKEKKIRGNDGANRTQRKKSKKERESRAWPQPFPQARLESWGKKALVREVFVRSQRRWDFKKGPPESSCNLMMRCSDDKLKTIGQL